MDKTSLLLLMLFFLFLAASLLGFFNLPDYGLAHVTTNSAEKMDPYLKKHLQSSIGLREVENGFRVKGTAKLFLKFNETEKVRLYFIGRAAGEQSTNFRLRRQGQLVDGGSFSLFEQYTSPVLALSGEEALTISGDLFISQLKLVEPSAYGNKFVFGQNWYPPENFYNPESPHYRFVWMSQNASLHFYNPAHPKRVRARMVLRSFHRPRTIIFEANGESQIIYVNNTLAEGKKPHITKPFLLKTGENTIKLRVREGCLVAKEVESSGDRRCLSLILDSIDLKNY